MSDVSWEQVAPVLADWDADGLGMLLDVTVHDTTMAEWQTVLDALPRHPGWRTRYTVDGEPEAWPVEAAAAWRRTEDASVLLAVTTPHLELAGHFFGVTGMEFAVEIRALTDENRWAELLDFAQWLHALLGSPVDLASEYDDSRVLVRITDGTAHQLG